MEGMSHEDLVDALRGIDGLTDVGVDPPNFHFRSQPILHFHEDDAGIYADVRLGAGGFEPMRASTPTERLALLGAVADHVERLGHSRKADRDRDRRRPGRR